jgi:DNA-binding response OmpR family regulator
MRLLIIEDDPKLAPLLARGLREEGFAVDVSGDGDDGASRAVEQDYDLIVLDVMLPGLDGFEVLEQLRTKGRRTPVLMLTSRGSVQDRVRGLNGGADDYLKTHSKEQRARYIKRHQKDLATGDPTRAGFLSRYLLWGESTSMMANLRAYRARFNL